MKHDDDLDITKWTEVHNPSLLNVELDGDVTEHFIVVTFPLFSSVDVDGQGRHIRVASFGGVLSHHHLLGRHFDIPLLLRKVLEVVLG